ncbi:secreted RxLR effector protein 161-like [Argentina anserina]|uniref:secreted RxLR effector protein 161-like n=1 Tax=Argentina anserina TaxID=57926 RepID=UPI0021762ADD|nr:secreted RxLR effector protein 161-like [Potentilla anserina]
MDSKPYARLVGSLMYAQVCIRPNLAFAVDMLSRFQSNLYIQHLNTCKKVLRYLQRTKYHMLVYKRVKNLVLVGDTDSDFVGNFPNSKYSTCGYVFMMAGGAVAWKTMKHTIVTTSTMQVEVVVVYEGVCEGLWIKNFLTETGILGALISKKLTMYCDNEIVVFFCKNSKRSTNSKHIDHKY